MGTRRATGYVGLLISLLVMVAPEQLGGEAAASLVYTGPRSAAPVADLYLDFDPLARRLIVSRRGQVFLVREARNDTVRPGQYGRYGHCPPGWFLVGAPRARNTARLGPYFLPLSDVRGETKEMARFRREAIGIHGGGTGLARPLAPEQGWKPTLGCIRLQNSSVVALVDLVRWTHGQGGKVWIRVGANPRVR